MKSNLLQALCPLDALQKIVDASYVLQVNYLQFGKLFQSMESLVVYICKISGDEDFQDVISAFRVIHKSLDVFWSETVDPACRSLCTNPVELRS